MRRRSAFASLALLAVVAGSALGTVNPAQTAGASPLLSLRKVRADFTPSLSGNRPIFILFIGSGARPGEDVEHSLSDSIHLVGINPARHRATVLGFPRDSWVDIPGHGSNKINAAMVEGGPMLLVQTIEDITGIKIDYYALTTFWGIAAMIDDIGGLVVDVPYPMSDPSYSRADFNAGPQRLNGHDVLAFSRDRHTLLSGDLGRSENGGRVFLCALQQFRKEYARDPSRLLTWLGAGARNIQTDLPLSEITTLAFTASQINPKYVNNVVTPATTGSQGAISVVYISSSAKPIYADMKGDGLVTAKHIPKAPEAGHESTTGSSCMSQKGK